MKKIRRIMAIVIVICAFFIGNLTVNSVYAKDNSVYLGGYTCGFSLKTKGVTVVAVTSVLTENGKSSPSKNSGIVVGDTILSLNGEQINSNVDIAKFLKGYNGGAVVSEIIRDNDKKLINLYPEKDVNGNYRLGIFVKEDLQGLGTVTFMTNDGKFASLGHPVSNEKGDILEVSGGSVYNSTIIGVTKGIRGKAGELKGMFIGSKPIGQITSNKEEGMYGELYNFNPLEYKKIQTGKAIVGKAQIYSTIDGSTPSYYDIEIVKTDFRQGNNKNLVIKIIDKDLILKTGGILQGMSGSPIIQNGTLVGAVTHVFINDSTRGFGISVENMLKNI